MNPNNRPPSLTPSLIIVGIIFVTFVIVRNPVTERIGSQLSLLLAAVLIGTYFWGLISEEHSPSTSKPFIYLLVASITSLIALTGWLFSPFYFMVYFLGIYLAFVLSPLACVIFIVSLVPLFSLSAGSVNLFYDFLRVATLPLVIPLALYLRSKFIYLLQIQKKILVLEKEKKDFKNAIEAVLSNKVSEFAATIRQPINDARQLIHQIKNLKDDAKIERNLKRAIASGNEAIHLLKTFEESVTGKNLFSSRETTSKVDQDNSLVTASL